MPEIWGKKYIKFQATAEQLSVLTIEIRYPHELKDGNDDQRVGGCIRVHQLQHVHAVLSHTQKIIITRNISHGLMHEKRLASWSTSGIRIVSAAWYLRDHGKSQEEEGEAADQGEDWFVLPQVLGELVRHRGHDGLNGRKLRKERAYVGVGGHGSNG